MKYHSKRQRRLKILRPNVSRRRFKAVHSNKKEKAKPSHKEGK